MYNLTLTQPEQKMLLEILDNEHKKLSVEIHRTDSRKYRASLVERQEALNKIIKEKQQQQNAKLYVATQGL